jgi:streptogramin lyase
MRLPRPAFFTPVVASIVAAGILAGATGCGSSPTVTVTQPPPGPYTGAGFAGKAMAGKQPLIGAAVQLYAAGSGGNGSAATALLSTALTTDVNGAFTVPAGYLCPLATSQIYVVARGGKPGAAAASPNTAITLFTALGACDQVAPSTQIVVNEVTSAAAAYALSQFLSAGANLGASSTNLAGLENAVATASALADITAGSSPGPSFASNGSSPAPKIDSLANLLNACTASAAGANTCSALFAATTPAAGAAPGNTFDAALNLVRNPGINVASLFALSTGSTVFAPVLAAAPSDWTLFVNYTGGGMNLPSGLGIDSVGNVWVASYNSAASLFSPLGKPILPQGITGFGLISSYGLAVDANDNAWIPNQPDYTLSGVFLPGNSVSVFNSSGQSVAGSSGFTGGGIYYPTGVAIDTDGSAWVVDDDDSHLTHLSSSGQALSGASGYTSPQLAFPVNAAIDANHNVWVVNSTAAVGATESAVVKVSPDGSQFTSFTCCNGPSNLAIDQLGNVWVTDYYGNSISELSSSGVVLSNPSYAGGGIDHPQGIAIDAAGNVWIASYRSPPNLSSALTELAGASNTAAPGTVLSPAAGLGLDAGLVEPFAVAVDASGNLWISAFATNTLTEFIGLAAPVRTPRIGPPAAP